jgi:hypothetical protein
MSRSLDLGNNWLMHARPLGSTNAGAISSGLEINARTTSLVLLLLLPIQLLIFALDFSSFYALYVVALSALLALCTYLVRKDAGWVFASVFFAAVCFQNLYLGVLLNFQSNPTLVPMLALIETKTAILFGGFAIVALHVIFSRTLAGWRADWGALCAGLFILVLCAGFLLSPAPGFSKIAEVRNLLAPVAAWYLGKFCVREERDFRRILGIVLATGVALSVVSLFELASNDFWGDYLQKDTLLALKGPTADDTDFLGVMVPRLYTGVGSPINASFIFSLLFLLTLYGKRYRLSSIFGIQSLLTFSKAGIGVGVVGLGIFMIRNQLTKATSWTRALWVAPAILLVLVSYLSIVGSDISDVTDLSSEGWSNTAVGHLRGLVGGLVQLPSAPWGHGLGVSGNMSEVGTAIGMTGSEDSDLDRRFEMGGESTIGTICYQLGILGFVSFAGWCLYGVRELFYASKRLQIILPCYAGLAMAGMAALLGVFISCFGSESAVVPQTGGIIFLLGGVLSGLDSITRRNRQLPSASPS